MRIMQWNAGRGLGDADNGILDVLAVEKGARVCLLQETVGFNPNGTVKALKESRRWSVFESGRASILVSQGVRAVECKQWARVAGVDGAVLDAVAVEVAGMGIAHPILLVSVYRDQTQSIPEAIEFLRELLFQLTAVSVIVGGDFNIHSTALGASRDGPQGGEFGSLVDELREIGGNCVNDGSPTWVGRVNRVAPCTPSHIDGTLFAPGLDWPIDLRDWRTGDQSQSDHVTIYYDIVEQSNEGPFTPDHVTKRREQCHVRVPPPLNWFQLKRKACTEDRLNMFSVNAEAVARGDQGGLRSEPAKEFASRVLGEIQTAALHCGLIKPWAAKPKKGVFRTYGWTETCARIYKARERAREQLKACVDEDERDEWRTKWKGHCLDLQSAARIAKEHEWQDFCSEIRADTPTKEIWGRVRRVGKTGKGQKGAATPMMRDANGLAVPTAGGQAQLLTDNWAWRSSADHPSTAAFSAPAKDRIEQEYDSIMLSVQERDTDLNEPAYCQLFGAMELDAILARVPKGKAAGWDGISYELLAALGPEMRSRVLSCINGLWVAGGVPEDWKEAVLVGLGKTESPTKAEDFRPVSLLVCLCKIHEALVHHRVEWVLDGRIKKLPPNDLGFRHNSTAVHQVLRATQQAHEAWERGCDLALVMLDVDKAFDTMWGVGLIVKLFRLGIRGRMLRWIDDYMKRRKCRAVVEGELSRDKTWDLGIGQGGILGPLFFVIYFSDMPLPPQSGGKFADDGSLWQRLSRVPAERAKGVEELQDLLDGIFEWAREWRATFSVKKTVFLVITPIRKKQFMIDNPVNLTMGGVKLTQVMEGGSRLLGIWIDPHLTFDCHVTKVGERAWRRIHVLRSITGTKWGADRVSLKNLYMGWVRPILEYGSYVYAGASAEVLGKLDKIQAAALRIITGTTSSACIESLHLETGIQYLGTRRLEELAITASALRRTSALANSAAADFQMWFGEPESSVSASRMVLSTSAESGYERAGGRMSPFDMIGGAYKLVGMWDFDVDLEGKDSVAGGYNRAPWVVPIPTKDRNWPKFKAASARSKEGAERARAYGTDRVREAYSEGANHGKDVLMAYTDGSADLIRGGGGAAVVWEGGALGGKTLVKDLGQIATSFMAEGEALLLAIASVDDAVKNLDPTMTRIHIWADCQPAIRLIDEGRTGTKCTYWKMAVRAKRMVDSFVKKGIEIFTDWLPAHCGIAQNELADKAANLIADRGREKGSVGVRVYRPHMVIRGAIRLRVKRMQDHWYRTSEMAKRARAMNPNARPRDIGRALREANLGREFETCLCRLRVGNETRPSGRVRMGITKTSRCFRCPGEDGTEHRLFVCPAFAVEREKARKSLLTVDSRLLFNMATLIGLWGVREGDMCRVLKVLSDYMDSLPGLREGFLETRRLNKKPGTGDESGVLLVKPVVPRKRKRAGVAAAGAEEAEPQPKRSRRSRISSAPPDREPRRSRKRRTRPDLPVPEEPADITMEPLTASDVEELERQFNIYEFYV